MTKQECPQCNKAVVNSGKYKDVKGCPEHGDSEIKRFKKWVKEFESLNHKQRVRLCIDACKLVPYKGECSWAQWTGGPKDSNLQDNYRTALEMSEKWLDDKVSSSDVIDFIFSTGGILPTTPPQINILAILLDDNMFSSVYCILHDVAEDVGYLSLMDKLNRVT
jgi:hypothetical protein